MEDVFFGFFIPPPPHTGLDFGGVGASLGVVLADQRFRGASDRFRCGVGSVGVWRILFGFGLILACPVSGVGWGRLPGWSVLLSMV